MQLPQFPDVGEEQVLVLAHCAPMGRAVGDRLAADALRDLVQSAVTALEAQVQAVAVPARRGQRQRTAREFGQAGQRRGLVEFERERAGGGRAGQHLQRHVEQHAERAEAAGVRACQVVARDVLHHLTAEAQHPAVTREHAHAEHVVAQRSGPGARRTGESAGDRAADRGRAAPGGRFERQALAASREQRLDVAQRRAGPCREHELARVVGDDAAVPGDLERLAVDRSAEERLAVAADDAERRRRPMRRAHLVDEGLGGVVLDHGSEPRQVGMGQLAAVHAQRTVVGAAGQRRYGLAGVQSTLGVERVLHRVEHLEFG